MLKNENRVPNLFTMTCLFGVLGLTTYLINASHKLMVCSIVYPFVLWLQYGMLQFSSRRITLSLLSISSCFALWIYGGKSIYIVSYIALFAASTLFLSFAKEETSMGNFFILGFAVFLLDEVFMGAFYLYKYSYDFFVSATVRSIVFKQTIYTFYLLPVMAYKKWVASQEIDAKS